MTFIYHLFLFLFLVISFLLCFFILIQESKSTGLGASFGGDTGDSLFGTSTPAILKKITGYLACAFLIGCVVLSLWTSSLSRARSKNQLSNTEWTP